MVHAAVNDKLVEQLRAAGLPRPQPVAEAFEYFAIGDEERARRYAAKALSENGAEQLRVAARVLAELKPALGPYRKHVQAVNLAPRSRQQGRLPRHGL